MTVKPIPCPFCDGGDYILAEPIVIQWLVNNVGVQTNRFAGSALVCNGCGRVGALRGRSRPPGRELASPRRPASARHRLRRRPRREAPVSPAFRQRLNDSVFDLGAGHEIRTRDPQLGKLMLYQLS